MENEQDTYEFIAKYFAGEALPEEAMAVDDWRASSLSNSSDFDKFSKIFKHDHQWDQQLGWQKILTLTGHPVKRLNQYRRLGIAASIILLLTIATLLFITNTKNESSRSIVYQTHAASYEIRLADSSLILMHPNSTLTLSRQFGIANRSLALKGSATFKVRHDSDKPFIVAIENLHIRDIGTIFSVTTLPNEDSVRVKVEEGEVVVYEDSARSIHLIAGQEVVYARFGKKLVLSPGQKPNLRLDTVAEKNNSVTEKKWARAQFQGELENSYLGISFDEAEKIINQPVKLVRRDSSFKNEVSIYSGHFQAITDEKNGLFYTISYHPDSALAHNYYIETIKASSGAKEMISMLKYGTEAVYETDQQIFYRIIFRKKNIIYTAWINKLKSSVSINELIKRAKRAAQAIH